MSVGTLASQTRNWPWREANEGRDKGDDDDDADVDGPVLAVAALGADIGGTGVVHGALATVTIVDRSAVGVIASKACMSATAATSSPVASSIATYVADVDDEAAEVVDVGGAAASLFLAATGAAVLMLVLLLLVLELTLTTLTPAACVCATSPDDAPAAPAAIAAAPLVLAPSAPIAVTSTGPLPPGASTHDDDATAAAALSRLPSVAGTGSTSFPITSAILRATPP